MSSTLWQGQHGSVELLPAGEAGGGLRGGAPAVVEAERKRAAGDPAGSAALLEAHLARWPRDHAGWFALGQAAADQTELEAATRHFARAVRLAPRCLPYLDRLAHVAGQSGQLRIAEAAFRSALAVGPTLASLHLGLGVVTIQQGREAGAVACFERALALDPGYALAYLYLAEASPPAPDSAHAASIQALLADPATGAGARECLHFALGRMLDAAGRVEDAFEHIRRANEVRRAQFDYDAEATSANVDALIEAFSRDRLAARHGKAGVASDVPVLVVGMPRSGTTLVEQIVASHRRAHGAGERRDLGLACQHIARALPGMALPHAMAAIDDATSVRLGRWYLERMRALSGDAVRIVDKMPHNFLRLGLAALMLPGARVIHCRRDAMDTCFSCYYRRFTEGLPFTHDFAELAAYHRDYQRLMAHWREALPLAMLEVDYERLVDDQEAETRRIIEFCGLEWDPRCLEFHRYGSDVMSSSVIQVRRPMNRDGVGKWRRYADRLGPLATALGRV